MVKTFTQEVNLTLNVVKSVTQELNLSWIYFKNSQYNITLYNLKLKSDTAYKK